ncbi:hypothetical protein PoB_006226800 [Plakobranchus ocellatus]|uniref:Uncharacterized protein n=1 Tax=Plakobranchus ocellatus TaxID=259542 RepID=A0AAV4CV44_9GAST|nr:hypothetical protein PoB_006226800 [Plakobranchus ocellatus]
MDAFKHLESSVNEHNDISLAMDTSQKLLHFLHFKDIKMYWISNTLLATLLESTALKSKGGLDFIIKGCCYLTLGFQEVTDKENKHPSALMSYFQEKTNPSKAIRTLRATKRT